jgi:glycosyltransferase involved in cell wall biosynthesis
VTTRRLRILYLLGGYGEEHIGGAIHREMALDIRARGHDYQIAVPARAVEAPRPTDLGEGIPVHRLVCGGSLVLDAVNQVTRPLFRFPSLLTLASRLGRLLRSERPFDVVIAEGAYPLGSAVWLASRRAPVPFLLSIVGADFLANEQANYGFARFAIPRRLMRAALRTAAVVRAISPLAGERAVALGAARDRLALVPRNIAASAFLPGSSDRESFHREARKRIAERFGTGDGPLVVAVGRLLPIKGFDTLVGALPQIRASIPAIRLLLVGPNRIDSRLGDYQLHLEAIARSAGVADRLGFAGAVPLEGVRDFLAAADMVAIPSIEEGGNKVLLEAAAVGTPFVATRTSGNAGWARDWNCGILIEPASPDQLASAIVGYLSDGARANVLGQNGLRFAEEFRTAHVADRMLDICQVAAEGGALPAELRAPPGLLHPGDRVRR